MAKQAGRTLVEVFTEDEFTELRASPRGDRVVHELNGDDLSGLLAGDVLFLSAQGERGVYVRLTPSAMQSCWLTVRV